MTDEPARAVPTTQPQAPGEETAEPEASGDAADRADDAPEAGEKVSKLSVEDLRARFAEITGRESKSSNRPYLIWRVQQAQKGRVPVGPRARRGDAGPAKVLPMRVPTAAIEPLDEVRRKLGLRSRNEMFHKAMASFLINAGESDLAGHFGATFSDDDDTE
jgi:hypothetical protein